MRPHRNSFLATAACVTLAAVGISVANAQTTENSQAAASVQTSRFKWATIVNNGDTMPGSDKLFSSYNQPSINNTGLVVFRARSKGSDAGGGGEGEDTRAGTGGGGGSSGGPTKGIYERNMNRKKTPLVKVFDNNSVVPDPNNLEATFNEFSSIPRIDMQSTMIATRGQSSPVWEYTLNSVDTRVGTSGIYMQAGKKTPFTGMSQLGTVPDFSHFRVPSIDTSTAIKFDQFPGGPAVTHREVVFKGNWTDSNNVGQTGVFYRDILGSKGLSPVQVIADTSTIIPNQPAGGTAKFGSTAPPSAAGQKMVFVGLDNEDAPTMGGVYLATIKAKSPLTTLVGIGDPVPGIAGATINKIGEGLSFNGRYVAFWAAWGTETRNITLQCPTDGNADLIAFCNQQYPTGFQTTEPVNQGIFVVDTAGKKKKLALLAQTGQDGFYNFIYWVFSGRPPGTGGGDEGDYEPARWRSSAFTALSTNGQSYRVAFKATKDDQVTQGIYLGSGPKPSLTSHVTVVDTNTAGSTLDPEVATLDAISTTGPLKVTAVGVERDGFRNHRLAVSASMANPDASVSWAGLYLALNPR